MTDAANTSSSEEWWDRDLTSAGRRDVLKAARLRLPSAVRWRHLSPEHRDAVSALRPTDAPLVGQAPPLTPQEALMQSKVENALLRAALFLNARALKDYQDAPHFEIDDDGTPKLEVIVLPSLRARAETALVKANQMLKDQDKGIHL